MSRPGHNAFVQFFRMRGIQLRFAALALSATEAIFLKKAILLSSPLTTFVLWSTLGAAVAAVAITPPAGTAAAAAADSHATGREPHLCPAGDHRTGLMQLATVLTFGTLQVGYSLALFQLSALISVFLGYRYFHGAADADADRRIACDDSRGGRDRDVRRSGLRRRHTTVPTLE